MFKRVAKERNIVDRKFNMPKDIKINSDEPRYRRQRDKDKKTLFIDKIVVVNFFALLSDFRFCYANETRISIQTILKVELKRTWGERAERI